MAEFVVINQLGTSVQVDLGFNRKGNFDFQILRPDGSAVPGNRLSEDGVGRSGTIVVGPMQTYKQILVLNEYYPFADVGQYVITAKFSGEVQTISGSPLKQEQRQELYLQILPRNPDRLEAICKGLSQKAITANNFEEANEASVALTYMIDPVAEPCLEDVLKHGRMVRSLAVVGLGRIANAKAVDALLAVTNDPDQEVAMLARRVLSELSRKTGESHKEKRIPQKALAERRGQNQ